MGLLRDRFGGEAAAAMRSFSSSLEVDLGMLAEDIAGSSRCNPTIYKRVV